jgi:hypothetical protein
MSEDSENKGTLKNLEMQKMPESTSDLYFSKHNYDN